MRHLLDDLGAQVALPTVRRVVSLVPSLTEAVACSAPDLLVGATQWCTHPADLDVPRYGGTKNPDVTGIVAASPDLVIANEEENKPEHIAALREAGIAVWVTDIRTVAQALTSIGRLLDALAAPERTWWEEARRVWDGLPDVPPERRRRAIVPIWRRPWMALGADTYAGDVLRRLGVDNALAASSERYPRFGVADLAQGVDLVVLPDEPYEFTPDDGPEAFAPRPCALVPGRPLTWYGPAMVTAPRILAAALGDPCADRGGPTSAGTSGTTTEAGS